MDCVKEAKDLWILGLCISMHINVSIVVANLDCIYKFVNIFFETYCFETRKWMWLTLESGINAPSWINIAPGKFGKKNNRSLIYTLFLYYLNRLYEVRNKAVAPGKKSKN